MNPYYNSSFTSHFNLQPSQPSEFRGPQSFVSDGVVYNRCDRNCAPHTHAPVSITNAPSGFQAHGQQWATNPFRLQGSSVSPSSFMSSMPQQNMSYMSQEQQQPQAFGLPPQSVNFGGPPSSASSMETQHPGGESYAGHGYAPPVGFQPGMSASSVGAAPPSAPWQFQQHSWPSQGSSFPPQQQQQYTSMPPSMPPGQPNFQSMFSTLPHQQPSPMQPSFASSYSHADPNFPGVNGPFGSAWMK